ncbi:hypothetical protein L1987_65574 [Smallanthus sonchifolius]|uniref:Uncharacterized protein n=1 Tax=Smallanthus sonchifolius TaxID=185202 RepID=A0ACB9BUQ9_9ASTR|nr:hypothetical protein L1987_65574 [Smallanthus sonchifolius]
MGGDDEFKKPLLSKVYYEGCPGCNVDQYKEVQTGLPIKEVFCIWIVVLCVALPISSLFPFLYFMIRDFNIAEKEEDISYYAGFVGSAYMIGRALTSIFWGVVADRYGRKPVIILGTSTVVIFNTLFGFSVNYWMAIVTRFLLGFLNGLLGPIVAYACELFREEHQALGLSSITSGKLIERRYYFCYSYANSTDWNCDLSPFSMKAILLYDPRKNSRNYEILMKSRNAFNLKKYLENKMETLHFHKKNELESASYVPDVEGIKDEEKDSTFMTLLKNWPLMSSIIVYCVFSLHDMAYNEVLSIPLLTSYPYIAMLSGFMVTFTLSCASIVKNVLSVSIITGTFMLQTKAVDQRQRGAANGIAMTLQSTFKAIGPACGGALLSWSQKRQNAAFLPGDRMIFFILNVIEGIGVLLTFKPFLTTNHY